MRNDRRRPPSFKLGKHSPEGQIRTLRLCLKKWKGSKSEARNPKSETIPKFKWPKGVLRLTHSLDFKHSIFGFVSYFVLRISDFSPSDYVRGPISPVPGRRYGTRTVIQSGRESPILLKVFINLQRRSAWMAIIQLHIIYTGQRFNALFSPARLNRKPISGQGRTL